MLLYYDHYGRDARSGFCFFGAKWPREIDPDINNRKGAGLLWNLFINIYGDHGYNPGAPESIFCLRGCFGPGTMVYGIADVKQDASGRYGTSVDFAVVLPQNEQEKQLELNPSPLIQELRTRHQPGSTREYRGDTMPRCKISTSAPRNYVNLAAELGWSSKKLLLVSSHPERDTLVYAMAMYSLLPVERRRNFSFLSYAVNWSTLYQMEGFDLIGVTESPDVMGNLSAMEQMGEEISYICPDRGVTHFPREGRDAGRGYLKRIYPLLLHDGQLDLPRDCGAWLHGSEFGLRCAGLFSTEQEALGLMLRAAASSKSRYYPLEQEKASISAAVFQ